MKQLLVPSSRVRALLLATLLVAPLLNMHAQVYPPWAVVGPPPPFAQGSSFGATMRNAAQATHSQAQLLSRVARDMARRSNAAGYQMQMFWQDYQNLQFQFQTLRSTYNLLGGMALELQRPRAANAAAELDEGLNIIAEAFAPVQQEIQAGMVNRDTVVRMCRILNEAMVEWDKELTRNTSRLGQVR